MATNTQTATPGIPRVQDAGWIVGKLIEHGRAPFQFEKGASGSYYIKLQVLESEQGARTRIEDADGRAQPSDGGYERRSPSTQDGGVRILWGSDLERAIRQSRSAVQVGKLVAAKIVARQPLSPNPAVVSKKDEPPRYKNLWEVETPQFVVQRSNFARAVNENHQAARREGINTPEALALYMIHEGARRLAQSRFPNADDQKAFVERVKNFFEVSQEREALIARTVQRMNELNAARKVSAPPTRAPEPLRQSPGHEPLVQE